MHGKARSGSWFLRDAASWRGAVVHAWCLLLLGSHLPAQHQGIVVRDKVGRPLRGANVMVMDAVGKETAVRTGLRGELLLPTGLKPESIRLSGGADDGSVGAVAVQAPELPGAPQEVRLERPQEPLPPKEKVGRVRTAVEKVPNLVREFGDARATFMLASVSGDRVDKVQALLKDFESQRQGTIAKLAEGAGTGSAEESWRQSQSADVLVQKWEGVQAELHSLINEASSNQSIKADVRDQLEVLGAAVGGTGAKLQDVASAVEVAVGELEVRVVDPELDGLGLAKSEVVVALRAYVLGADGKPAASVGVAAKEVVVTLRRERCQATPAALAITKGASIAAAFVTSDHTDGAACIVAESPGYPSTTEVRVALRVPWRSLGVVLFGLVLGTLLKPKVSPGPAKRPRGWKEFLVDAGAGFTLLAAYFAGYLAVVAPRLEFLDLRNGFWTKLFGSIIFGIVGLPYLAGWVKKLLAKHP